MSNSEKLPHAMKKLPALKRNRICLSQADLVRTSLLDEASQLPLVIHPAVEGACLSDWTAVNGEFLSSSLRTHGGVLFRGFTMETEADFERFVKAVVVKPMHYIEGAT